jgi:hypothetical protein
VVVADFAFDEYLNAGSVAIDWKLPKKRLQSALENRNEIAFTSAPSSKMNEQESVTATEQTGTNSSTISFIHCQKLSIHPQGN